MCSSDLLHQYVVGNFQNQLMLDVVIADALQNQDAQNQDAVLPFQVVAHPDVDRPDVVHQVVAADVALNRQLKMDYYQGVVVLEQSHQLKMDYYQDVVLQVLALQVLALQSLHSLKFSHLLAQFFQHHDWL